MELLKAYLGETATSWFGVVGVVSTIVWVLEMAGLKIPKLRPTLALVVAFACFSIAQFQTYRTMAAKADALYAQLHPDIRVYMRWPESWFWNGERYPQSAKITLDDSAKLEMQTKTLQRMDPMAFAPPAQRLSDIAVFLMFSRPVTQRVCDPTRPPLAIWTTNENNSFYSHIVHPINPGLGGNVPEAFCFSVDAPGDLGVTYTFGPAETPPVRGHFNIVVKDRPTP